MGNMQVMTWGEKLGGLKVESAGVESLRLCSQGGLPNVLGSGFSQVGCAQVAVGVEDTDCGRGPSSSGCVIS